MFRRRTVDPLAQLTDSERDVLALLAEGLSNTAIADGLHISIKTVEKRLTAINQKLGLRTSGTERPDVNVRVLAVLTYLRSAPGTGTART